jgi:mannobiose 2-epimerase
MVAMAAVTTRAEKPDPAAMRKWAERVENHLRRGVLDVWFPRCLDRLQGGFLADFAEDWTPTGPHDKTIVYQARMTWVAARVAFTRPDLAEQYRVYVRHGVDCLTQRMWDQEQGGFYWGLDRAGKVIDRYGTEKHAYGMAFGIYALAAAYEATRDARTLDLARQAMLWFDRAAHDATHGGYYEALGCDGKPILSLDEARRAGGKRDRDAIGTCYGYKSMNSHIHLLEAVTALYHVWPDALVRRRLEELLSVVRDRVAVRPGCLNLYFTPDWRAVPDHDSFGHDVETAYLLLEAAEALGKPNDDATLAMARALVDHALEWGWDERQGGFYDKGAAFAPAWGRDKIWWTQAEGLNALLLMHERFGRETPRYWAAFERQWDFLWRHQIDQRNGEWHGTVLEDGSPKPGPKASVWKAAYHNGRALMNVADRLRQMGRWWFVLLGGGGGVNARRSSNCPCCQPGRELQSIEIDSQFRIAAPSWLTINWFR